MKKNIKKLILVVMVVSVLSASFHCFSNNVTNAFTDVPENEWFAESVKYVKDKGLMNGITVTTFEPQTSITRGMIVTIIYRLEGSPEVKSELPFSDVNSTYYYCTPIIWASENGIVNGYSKDTFAPDDEITREQFATILYRYAEKKSIDVSISSKGTDLSSFEDESKISEYAVKAISWANENGLIKGVTVTTLEPQGKATRAQAATIFMRFCKLLEQAQENDDLVEPENKDNEKDPDTSTKNDGPSSGNGSDSKKEPAIDKDEGKDNVKEDDDENDNDENSGEWDDVKDENSKDENVNEENDKQEENVTFTDPTIVVDSFSAETGESIEVNVTLHNNPGVLGAILNFIFDEELTLVDVKKGDAFSELEMTKPGKFVSNCNFVFDGLDEAAKNDGEILTLYFDVSAKAKKGDKLKIKCSYLPGDIVDENFEEVEISVVSGTITVK